MQAQADLLAPSNNNFRRRQSLSKNDLSAASKLLAAVNLDNAEKSAYLRIYSIEDIRILVKHFLYKSTLGIVYNDVMLCISILSCFEFIYQTYLNPNRPEDIKELHVLDYIEKGLAVLFTFDWLLNLFIADLKLIFMTSFYSMVDVLTVIPIWVTSGRTCPDIDFIVTAEDVFIYLMFLLSTTRVLRALRIRRKLISIEDAVKRNIGEISVDITLMILFFASVLQFLESKNQPHAYHTWMYVVWITIATVGYGDITPKTTLGRIADMMFIAFAVVSVPKMTNELFEKMKLQSVYARAAYIQKSKFSKHCVVCGSINVKNLRDFMIELFHEDHKENDFMHVVVLSPEEPAKEILLLLRDNPLYENSVTYLVGSALLSKDLQRAKVESSVAVFLLANKFTCEVDEEDSKIMLQNLCIRKYLSSAKAHQENGMKYFHELLSSGKGTIFCMQLLKQESLFHMGSRDLEVTDENNVVCIDQMKMGILSKALLCPGSNTLITNLISSFSIEDDDGPKKSPWLMEYQNGCDWEIYVSELSTIFEGVSFAHLSYMIYEKKGVIQDLKTKQSKLFLNPAEYLIPSQDDFKIDCFVIARNKADGDLTFPSEKLDHKEGYMISEQFGFKFKKNSKVVLVEASAGGGCIDIQVPSPNLQSHRSRLASSMSNLETFIDTQQSKSYYEDIYFRKNYYLREERVEMQDVIVKTALLDEYPYVNHHTLVVGVASSSSNLYDLIKSLRSKFMGSMRYIVLLYTTAIPIDVWSRISIFDGVLILRGSALEESTLRRAGIFRAKKVIVLSDGIRSGRLSTKSGMEALVDSDAIFSYQCVHRLNPNAQIVIEIVNQSSIAYIDLDMDSAEENYMFTPQFAGGNLFTTAILDLLVCQVYYNPNIINVVNKLASGVDRQQISAMKKHLKRSGLKKIDPNKGKRSSSRSKGDDDDTDLLDDDDDFGEGDDDMDFDPLDQIRSSCLYQMAIPEKFYLKKYGDLIQDLYKQNIIPLGLYRGVFAGMTLGANENKCPYVYTNPDKDVTLYSCDKIFCLSMIPMVDNEVLNVKDWILDIQLQNNAHKPSALNTPAADNESSEILKHMDEQTTLFNKGYLDIMKRLRSCNKMKSKHRQQPHRFLSSDSKDDDGWRQRQQAGSYDSQESQSSSISQDKNESQHNIYGSRPTSAKNESILQLGGSIHSIKHASPPQGILRKHSVDGLGDGTLTSTSVKKKYSFSDPVVTRVSKIDGRQESTLEEVNESNFEEHKRSNSKEILSPSQLVAVTGKDEEEEGDEDEDSSDTASADAGS